MPPGPEMPDGFGFRPFRGSAAVEGGVLSWGRLRHKAWRRLYPDVYIRADLPLDHRVWCEAAFVYTGYRPGIAVSGLSAAALMGVDLTKPDDPVELTVPPSTRLGTRISTRERESRLAIVRSVLSPADIVSIGRLPVAAPERTAFDVARRLTRVDAVIAVDAMLNRRLVTLNAIRDYLLANPMGHGRSRVAKVLALVEPGAGSPMETTLRLRLVEGGLPRPEAQVWVVGLGGELLGRVDLAYRERRIGIEYEGDYHRDRATFRRDIARVNAMQEAGWIIIRVTAADIRDPRALLRQLRALLSRPGDPH